MNPSQGSHNPPFRTNPKRAIHFDYLLSLSPKTNPNLNKNLCTNKCLTNNHAICDHKYNRIAHISIRQNLDYILNKIPKSKTKSSHKPEPGIIHWFAKWKQWKSL